MTIASKAIVLLCLSIIPAACATNSYNHTMTDEVDVLMKKYDGQVPGASLLVVKDGTPVVRRSWGMADIENHVSATPETNYRLASVTKQFTAAAILLLLEDKKLSLNDRVRTWFPSLPKRSIQSPSNTSSRTHRESSITKISFQRERRRRYTTLMCCECSNRRTARTSHRARNISTATAATPCSPSSSSAHQEKVREFSSRPYFRAAWNEQHCRIREWYFDCIESSIWLHDERRCMDQKDQSLTSAVLGDGGIYSSIDDMAKWDAALYDSRLLSDESRRLAFTPHTATDKPDVKYGFGWRITGEAIWHSERRPDSGTSSFVIHRSG